MCPISRVFLTLMSTFKGLAKNTCSFSWILKIRACSKLRVLKTVAVRFHRYILIEGVKIGVNPVK